MPPIKKVSKEQIIAATCEIIQRDGLSAVNARLIARKLHCSVQPIFSNFINMDDLKKTVIDVAHQTYREYLLKEIKGEKPYKAMGKNYLRFAREKAEFFKILFMQNVNSRPLDFMMSNDTFSLIVGTIPNELNLSQEELRDFQLKMWMFTHGIATLLATKTCDFTDEEIERLLTDEFLALRELYILKKGKDNK